MTTLEQRLTCCKRKGRSLAVLSVTWRPTSSWAGRRGDRAREPARHHPASGRRPRPPRASEQALARTAKPCFWDVLEMAAVRAGRA